MQYTHSSPYAGTWYPRDPSALREMLDLQFDRARKSHLDPALDVAYVVPHAGLEYSGTVASSAYVRLAQTGRQPVVLLGFTHSGTEHGISVPDFDAYETPLGIVQADGRCRQALLEREPFLSRRAVDHSVEIQLPLLQNAVPGARIVPMYAGAMDAAAIERAATAIAALIGGGAAVVASTDLTHYGRHFGYVPFPADDRVAERLRQLDTRIIDSIMTLDVDHFLETLQTTGSTMCGVMPVAVLIVALKKLNHPIQPLLLAYASSAEVSGDYRSCVSYAALCFRRSTRCDELR